MGKKSVEDVKKLKIQMNFINTTSVASVSLEKVSKW